eukprot:653311-Heterocapsa_arctica.AAC.1
MDTSSRGTRMREDDGGNDINDDSKRQRPAGEAEVHPGQQPATPADLPVQQPADLWIQLMGDPRWAALLGGGSPGSAD